MELIYSMRRKPLKCEPPHFESLTDAEVTRPICTISSCNTIAFSSPTELSDSDGGTWGGHVYVCDIDTPWDAHKVTSTVHPVSALEWDSEGKQLLVATTVGEVSVFGMKDYLLNDWYALYSASFPGEHIIKAAFFHNGRRVVMTDKKPDAPITERIQTLRPTPTLKGFGGIACEGACVVSATGLLGALTPAGGGRAFTAADCLRPQRDHVTAAAIAHKNGNLVVAAVCGGGRAVRCFVWSLAAPRGPRAAPALALQPLPTIHTDAPCTAVQWCLREDTDVLALGGAALSVWQLADHKHPVHKLLAKGPVQGSTTPGGGQKQGADCFNTMVWQPVWSAALEGGCAALCARRLAAAAPLLLAAAPARLLLARDQRLVCAAPLVTHAAHEPPGTPPKKTKYAGSLPPGCACAVAACVDMSWLGGVACCVDSHAQLHLYRLPHTAPDHASAAGVAQLAALLEYSAVSGYDCRDLILTLKPPVLELLYERITETFQRQPAAFQQYYYQSWLKLRIALCRSVPTMQSSVSNLTCLLTLSAVWAVWAAGAHDKDAADHEPHDKPPLAAAPPAPAAPAALAAPALAALADKPEWGEREAAALAALRRPLQLAADIALTALQHAANHHAHGYELWTDSTALALLRKLVAAGAGGAGGAGRGARGAGGAGGGVPGGAELARVLARLHHPAPSKEVREECAALCLQQPRRVWESLPRVAVSAPHGRALPLYFEYGVEPEELRYAPEPPSYGQCDVVPAQGMDSIRYMYLGGGRRAARWRQCGRCGARALPAARPSKHPLQRAYDGRFLATCRCGGKWTLVSNY